MEPPITAQLAGVFIVKTGDKQMTYIKPPRIGARILKSAAAVAICMLIYYIRELLPVGSGMPFYSALAALWCMQPYNDSTKNNAGQRSIGTLIGSAFGLAFLLILRPLHIPEPAVVYLIASAVIIPVIYTTVLMNKRTAAFFSCVVFLSIALTHSFDSDPYIFVFNRMLDTFIGIAVGVGINDLRLPTKHDYETLYVSGIDDVLISSDKHTAQYSKVELNRIIKEGVKFTISTVRTPAELMSLMDGVELRYPVIAMDGAALYDVKEKQYIETVFLDREVCSEAERIIAESCLHCFVNAMYDTTLLIYYGELENTAEKDLYETHRRSPYRNYVRSELRRYDEFENVLYFTVLAKEERVTALEKKLHAALHDSVRITVTASEYDGYPYLKVFSPKASKQEMMKKLKEYTKAEKVVTFGSIKGEYDVYIGDGGGNATVKKLKRLYRKSSV